MKKTLALIAKGKELLARARKAAVPAVAALGLIVGTSSSIYVDATMILVALGVYQVPNKRVRR